LPPTFRRKVGASLYLPPPDWLIDRSILHLADREGGFAPHGANITDEVCGNSNANIIGSYRAALSEDGLNIDF
jgi:hypothetical protein